MSIYTLLHRANETARHGRGLQMACMCFMFAAVFSTCLAAQGPQLAVDTKNIGTTVHISFRASDPTVASNPVIQAQYSYETGNHKYSAFLDPAGIRAVPASPLGEYTFTVLIKPKGDSNWYSYDVIATPFGDFADFVDDVQGTVGQGADADTLTIRLPLHSAQYKDDLVWRNDDPNDQSRTLQVKVSDSQGPTIPLHNNLKNLTIHITKVEVKRTCTQCWQDTQPGVVDIPSADGQPVPLNIRPKALSALVSTASKIKRDAAHDSLTVTVYYNVDQGGPAKHTQFDVTVRFSPSFWQLSMVVIAGSLLGLSLRGVLEKLRPIKKGAATNQQTASGWKSLGKTTAHAGTTLFLTSVGVALLIVVAFSDSKLVILGLDLDPRQMVPAFIIAGYIAGGSPVRKWAGDILRLGDKNQAAQAAAGGGD